MRGHETRHEKRNNTRQIEDRDQEVKTIEIQTSTNTELNPKLNTMLKVKIKINSYKVKQKNTITSASRRQTQMITQKRYRDKELKKKMKNDRNRSLEVSVAAAQIGAGIFPHRLHRPSLQEAVVPASSTWERAKRSHPSMAGQRRFVARRRELEEVGSPAASLWATRGLTSKLLARIPVYLETTRDDSLLEA